MAGSGQLDWPSSGTTPAALPPRGGHHYAVLGVTGDNEGYRECCCRFGTLRELVGANQYSEGPAPDATAAKAIRLTDARVTRQGTTLAIDVNLVNGTSQIIHSGSANPLLLSWRLLADGATPAGWETRVSPGADIPAGATRAVHFAIDGAGHKAGDHLQLSFVVEERFWGHDIGVPPVDLVVP